MELQIIEALDVYFLTMLYIFKYKTIIVLTENYESMREICSTWARVEIKRSIYIGMNDIITFKNRIFLYGVIISLLCALISIIFIGVNVQFLYGLALGTSIAIVNFQLLAFTLKKVLGGLGAYLAFVGYLFRLMIYGGAFYASMRIGLNSGMGTLFGFMTLKIAIYYLYGFRAKFSTNRKVSPEVQAEYERMDAVKEKGEARGIWREIKNEFSSQEDKEITEDEERN